MKQISTWISVLLIGKNPISQLFNNQSGPIISSHLLSAPCQKPTEARIETTGLLFMKKDCTLELQYNDTVTRRFVIIFKALIVKEGMIQLNYLRGILRSLSLRTRRVCGPCSCWTTSSCEGCC